MLRKVCLQIKNLLSMGKKLFPISVNFSPVHLKDQDFVLKITNIVDSFSKIGINSLGGISPISGLLQRTSASAPQILSVDKLNFG